MFPVGPRRPMPPRSPFSPRRPLQEPQNPNRINLMSLLQDADGNMDFEKISTTVAQVNKIYGQVSPMISRFMKR